MGSFDTAPDGWDDYADIAWTPPHVIFCNSKWMGQERHSHRTAGEVRECFRAAQDTALGVEVWPCGWLLEARYDDGSAYSYPCEQPARYTDERGSHECMAGHGHVPAQVRFEEGWDYAEDADEAAWLRRNGIDAVSMRGDSI